MIKSVSIFKLYDLFILKATKFVNVMNQKCREGRQTYDEFEDEIII